MKTLVFVGMFFVLNCSAVAEEVTPIGTRRELFVETGLVEQLTGGAELRLNHPVPREVSLVTDAPWEGNATNYVTAFQDGEVYRLYYRGSHASYLEGKDRPSTRDVYCYAESRDGIHWDKPTVGAFEWEGSKQNNIILDGIGGHAFAPFKDTNPAATSEAKYKALAVGGGKHGLYAFQSADAIHWTMMSPDPVITLGAFDSLNLAFWDSERGEYREYHRDFRQGRDIRTSTSKDFLNWSEPQFLSYAAQVDPRHVPPGTTDVKDPVGESYPPGRVSELYTNQITPYYRAPHLLLGFPTRYIDRDWTQSAKALPRYDYRQVRAKASRREGTALTDGLLMASRDRGQFLVWPESFVRPGLHLRDSWFYGDAYQNWGIVETPANFEDGPPELSFYVTERTLQETGGVLRRYSLRIDGFVSLSAPLSGGEMTTKPITFAGNRLVLNVSTSAAGAVRVELQDLTGVPIPGFSLADCDPIYGDDLARQVSWQGHADVTRIAGKPVRLKIEVKDADVYSYVFESRKD